MDVMVVSRVCLYMFFEVFSKALRNADPVLGFWTFLLQDPTPDPEFSDKDPDPNSAFLLIKKKV